MLTREATYEDYGFSEDEDKRLGEFCKNLEMRDKILLLQCAAEVYECAGAASVVEGLQKGKCQKEITGP